jgi:hypothetical protein
MVFNAVPFLSLSRLNDYVFLLPSTSWCYCLVLKEDCRFCAHINFFLQCQTLSPWNLWPHHLAIQSPILILTSACNPSTWVACDFFSVTFRVIVGLILFALGNVPDDDLEYFSWWRFSFLQMPITACPFLLICALQIFLCSSVVVYRSYSGISFLNVHVLCCLLLSEFRDLCLFLAMEQCFPLIIFQHKHQRKPNFSISEQSVVLLLLCSY